MSPLTPRDPAQIGFYRLVSRLGVGGFGVVYEATDPVGSRVAIKLLNADLAEDPSFRSRLVREGESMRLVDSDRVAKVIEVVVEESDNDRGWS